MIAVMTGLANLKQKQGRHPPKLVVSNDLLNILEQFTAARCIFDNETTNDLL